MQKYEGFFFFAMKRTSNSKCFITVIFDKWSLDSKKVLAWGRLMPISLIGDSKLSVGVCACVSCDRILTCFSYILTPEL